MWRYWEQKGLWFNVLVAPLPRFESWGFGCCISWQHVVCFLCFLPLESEQLFKNKQLDIMENWWILWKLWKTKLLLMKNKQATETWWLSFYFWMQCFPSNISVFSFSMIYSRIMQTGLRIQKDDKIRTTSWKCWLWKVSMTTWCISVRSDFF